MATHSIKNRLLAVFIVAFVCLNAGGGACVVYCRTENAVETEHCPLKKTDEHCDKSVQSEQEHASLDVGTSELDCCPMTVSFFAAPIEKNTLSFEKAAVAAASQRKSFKFAFSADSNIPNSIAYRGPPPRDVRDLRIQHCVIRI